jgi:nucleoid DNA-binding protein
MADINLIQKVADCARISTSQAQRVINCYHKVLTGNLLEGKPVIVRGFGTYSISKSPTRMFQNPRTGEKMEIPTKTILKFTVAPSLSSKFTKIKISATYRKKG